jgi:hypothetical protein
MKRTALSLAAAGALALPAAALAHGHKGIVINESIAGARLGMTPAQVRAAVGKPAQILHTSKKIMEYNYGVADELEVDFDTVDGKMLVTEVTLEPGYGNFSTSKGIKIGSTKNAVVHAYPDAKFNNAIGQIWIDQLGKHNTSFLLSRSNHVIQVSVSWNYG